MEQIRRSCGRVIAEYSYEFLRHVLFVMVINDHTLDSIDYKLDQTKYAIEILFTTGQEQSTKSAEENDSSGALLE